MSVVGISSAGFSCAHDEFSTGTWVHDLRVEGNKAFSAGDLTEKLATQKTGWWPFAGKKWFDQAAFDLDLKRVAAFYSDRGYFDARVIGHQVKPAAGKRDAVDVVITVQENSPTQVAAVRMKGFPSAEESRAHKDAAWWNLQPGKRFDYDAYGSLKQSLNDRLKQGGYAYGDVVGAVSVDRDKHVADLSFDSHPGPKVRFGRTTIEGNGGIPAWKLLRRVTWNQGDVYDPDDLATTQGRLYNLGVFSSVRIDLPPVPTDVADVVVHVQPGPLRELRLGAGVGADRARDEVRLRAEWTFSNFLGGLRRLRLRSLPAYVVIPSVTNIQRSGLAAENDAELTQPDVLATSVTLHALAGYDLGIAEGYQFYGPRAQLGGDRPFVRNRLLVGASWNLQYLNFFNVDEDVFGGASQRFFGFKNPYRLAYVEEFAQVDLRNRPLDPTLGTYLSLHVEEGDPAVGGDFRYVKVSPEARGYVPLGHRVVLAGRALLGWIKTYGGEESPITRRFRFGGPANHRGFGFGRLSPQAPDAQGRLIPYGGDGALLFSGEVRIEATKISGAWLALIPFVDAGDVTTTFGALDVRRLHVAPGLDAAYTTPIGIVRAGAAVRVNRMGGSNPDPGDRFAYHITIGEAF
ncbi:MAG TPA: POTRA domain-containing protein [Polyangia bacterium]|nr:POTRA domain-containing protein [Polyangia bacterium]